MKAIIIGSGNVASSLGVALQKSGLDVVMIYGRTIESVSALASVMDVPYTLSLDELPYDADICFSMLADDALLKLASKIVSGRENMLFVHTAGSIPLSLWADAGAKKYGVFYPMQTFSKGKDVDWSNLPVFVEGNTSQTLEIIKGIANSVSGNVQVLNSEDRKRLHLAAVFSCNFANRMFAISESLLESSGVSFDVMLPLVKEMVNKVERISPAKAQTGPAVRNDQKVMQAHLDLLKDTPQWAELYHLISEDIIKSR